MVNSVHDLLQLISVIDCSTRMKGHKMVSILTSFPINQAFPEKELLWQTGLPLRG